VPDALASAAKQLADKGWQPGKAWGLEVRVPANLDCTIADPENLMPIGEWMKRGYIPAHGGIMSSAQLAEPASLLMPAGTYGPAFLILKITTSSRNTILRPLRALCRASRRPHRRRAGVQVPWRLVVQLHTMQLEEMQRRLNALGLYRDKIDGKAGMARGSLGASKGKRPQARLLAHDSCALTHAEQSRQLNKKPGSASTAGLKLEKLDRAADQYCGQKYRGRL
jgi:hypothetical protein